jgi:methylmalonyl-CoA mutase, C-terminal domain
LIREIAVQAMEKQKIRCMLGMLGTDVHTKGIRTLSQLLRDAGVEVIYLGEHNTVEGMVSAVIAEDPDVLGLSFSTASYLQYVERLMAQMRHKDVADVPVMLGGLIHTDDHAALKALGVQGIFGPGSTLPSIMEFLELAAAARKAG